MTDTLVVIKSHYKRPYPTDLLDRCDSAGVNTLVTHQVISEFAVFDLNYVEKGKFVIKEGKANYWKVWDMIFKLIKFKHYQHIIQLDDDLELAPDFFSRLKRLVSKHPDTVINLLTDERCFRPNWSHLYPIQHKDYWLNYWVDCIHYMPRTVLEKLNYKMLPINALRWQLNPSASSGVGKQITARLHSLGIDIIAPKKSLTLHKGQESIMNKEERDKTPLDNSKYFYE